MFGKTLAVIFGTSSSILAYKYYVKSEPLNAENNVSATANGKVNEDFTKLGYLPETEFSSNSNNNNITNNGCEWKSLREHASANSHTLKYNQKYKHLVPKLFNVLHQVKEETGSPGISFAISLDGDLVMKGGIGLADVENGMLMTSETILRIASISKSLTSVAVGKLMEDGKINIDKPIQAYFKDFKPKKFNGKPVTITTKQLLSHTSGIRGYFEDPAKFSESLKKDEKSKLKNSIFLSKMGDEKSKKEWNENFIMEHYDTVKDGLVLFQEDPLIYEPGKGSEYSSLAYSLVSQLIEEVSGQDYVTFMKAVCQDLGLDNTCVDLNDPIISNRGRYYRRSKKNHLLENVPYVDNSYKWSGGGFLSNTDDLVVFGNEMLKSYQQNGLLDVSTMKTLWSPVTNLGKPKSRYHYALGWAVSSPEETAKGNFTVRHSGGAVGVSSVLHITPHIEHDVKNSNNNSAMKKKTLNGDKEAVKIQQPKGVVVALIVNMQGIGLTKTAEKLVHILKDQ